jgi:hypothetical protein
MLRGRADSVGRNPPHSSIQVWRTRARGGPPSLDSHYGELLLQKYSNTEKDGLLYLNDPLAYSIEPLSRAGPPENLTQCMAGRASWGAGKPQTLFSVKFMDSRDCSIVGRPCRLEPHMSPSPPGEPPLPASFDSQAALPPRTSQATVPSR